MNRGIELILAGCLAVFLAPAIMFVAILVLVLDGRPVFFVSDRIGGHGGRFGMIKFRTMRPASDSGVTGGDKARRITRLGRILRRARLDELPQIWNILRGDLVFVGPRPPAPEYVAAEPELYAQVISVAHPGVTGLATLAFHAREEAILATGRTAAEVDQLYRRRCIRRKARIDMLYAGHRSLGSDLWLMALTGLRVVGFGGRGRLPRRRGGGSGSDPIRFARTRAGSDSGTVTGRRPSERNLRPNKIAQI